VSHGEFNPGAFGISVPVFDGEGMVVGGIGVAGAEDGQIARACLHVAGAAKRLSEILADEVAEIVRPPRAFGSVSARPAR
jgi:DNA-binding IclR family transcriptional regulator